MLNRTYMLDFFNSWKIFEFGVYKINVQNTNRK